MIVALCVLSDGRIASASSDGHAIVRRLDPSRTQPDRLDDDSLPLYTASIARSEDGKVLIVATREAAVRVLCTASEFKWVCAFYCDSAAIECARSSAGRIIGAGDFAGNVHVLRLHQPDTS